MKLTATQESTQAVDVLVDQYLPLARRLARRYRHTSVAQDDLDQVAALGLVKAAQRFDPARGTSFSGFAVPSILGELRRHIRDQGWAVRVPRGLQEAVQGVGKARDELHASLGRSPTPRELAEYTEIPVETVLEAIEAGGAYRAEPLYCSRSEDDDSESLLERLPGVDEPGYELVEYGASIGPEWQRLSSRERTAVWLRFVEDQTQSEIAARIGVSQMQVSRLLRRALDRLRSAAGDEAVAA